MSFVQGDIVTVTLDCFLQGHQGIVHQISDDKNPEGNIEVEFYKELSYLFDAYPQRHETNRVRFEEKDLQKDSDWSAKTKVQRLFGRRWNVIYTHNKPLDLKSLCDHKDCSHQSTTRIMVNTWGTVAEFDVCDNHKDWHGKCCDGFPSRQIAAAK